MTALAERKMHRKYFSSIGWALLIYLLIMNASVIAFAVWDAVTISLRQSMGTVISDSEKTEILMSNGWGYMVTIVIGFAALWLWKGRGFVCKTLWTRSRPMKFGSFVALLCLFISGQSVFQVVASVQEAILNVFGLSALESIESATMNSDSLSMFLYAAIGAPIMEEIIFRGLVLRQLEPYGKGFAVVMSAFTFGIFHGNIVQIPYAFLVGLVMGYVAIEYNIVWAMVLHMINNLVLGDLITRVLPGVPGNAVTSLIIMACSLVAAVLLLVRLKDIREYYEKNPIRDADAGNFFSAPGMIALELFVLFGVASPLVAQIMEKLGQ